MALQPTGSRSGFLVGLCFTALACWILLGVWWFFVRQPDRHDDHRFSLMSPMAVGQFIADAASDNAIGTAATDDVPQPAAERRSPSELLDDTPAAPRSQSVDIVQQSLQEVTSRLRQLTDEQEILRKELSTLQTQIADHPAGQDLAVLRQDLQELSSRLSQWNAQDRDWKQQTSLLLQEWTNPPASAAEAANATAPRAMEQHAPSLPATELVTKLYRPRTVEAQAAGQLLGPLLTPHVGRWAAVPLSASTPAAIVVRDTPPVITQVDRLIQELDRPVKGVRLDITVRSVDSLTRRPLGAPVTISSDQMEHDGRTFKVAGSLLFPEVGPADCLPLVEPFSSSATATSSGLSASPNPVERWLEVTPHVVD